MQMFQHINEAYPAILEDLLHLSGTHSSPRGMPTIEICGYSFELEDAKGGMLSNPVRKINVPFMLAEWLWIWLGHNTADLIVPYNSQMDKFHEGGSFRGAYGPKLVDQLGYVVDTLTRDQDSRQAVLSFWRERPGPAKDIPCTLTMQFMLRNRPYYRENPSLELYVNMRSNDAWLGLPYDVFTFTAIQQQVALLLGVQAGKYHHHVGSLHLYEQHWEEADKLIEQDKTALMSRYAFPIWTPMPPAFKTMFSGLTLLSDQGTPQDIIRWVSLNADAMEQPWGGILRTLAYRFHKQHGLLSGFWQNVIPAPR